MPSDPDTGTIVVSRTLPKGMRIRSLDVLIDGEFVADLPFGSACERSVATGEHLVSVSNRLFSKKLMVNVRPGEVLQFEAGNVVTGMAALFLSLGMPYYRVFLEPANRTSP